MNDAHDGESTTESLARLDLNLVLAFDAIAREESVTRAAARLGVTQSAMSHALRRLREMLGDPLFVRGRTGLTPTPRAEALRLPLRTGLLTIHRALRRPDPFEPATTQRRFAIASPDLFDILMLPPLLDRLRAVAPGVDLAVSSLDERRLSERLESGELDIAVLPHVDDVPRAVTPGLVRRTLFRDAFACLTRDGHPALGRARGSKRLTAKKFAALSHVMVSPEGEGPGLVDRALAQQGLSRRIALRVPSFVSAVAILATSDLVLTGPTALARMAAFSGALFVSRPPIELPEHSVDLVWHERYTDDPGHRWFREVTVAVAHETLREHRPGARARRA